MPIQKVYVTYEGDTPTHYCPDPIGGGAVPEAWIQKCQGTREGGVCTYSCQSHHLWNETWGLTGRGIPSQTLW